MIYIILIFLLAGIIFFDYVPKRKMLSRPLRWFYLGTCLFCFIVLMLDQLGVPFPRIATGLTWMIEKVYGV